MLIYLTATKLKLDMKLGAGQFNENILSKAVNVNARNLAAVNIYANYTDPDTEEHIFGRKGLINCVDIKHAQDVAKLFNEVLTDEVAQLPQFAGKNVQVAAAISGDMDYAEIKETLERHKRGEILILCQARMLGRGHDDPSLSFCINLRPTLSRVEAEQRGGRVLRSDFGYLFDIVDEGKKVAPVLFAEVSGGPFFIDPKTVRKRDAARAAGKKYVDVGGGYEAEQVEGMSSPQFHVQFQLCGSEINQHVTACSPSTA